MVQIGNVYAIFAPSATVERMIIFGLTKLQLAICVLSRTRADLCIW